MDDENWIEINEELRIPMAEVRFRFSTSRGPGGQHANRSATRVTLTFDVKNSPSLSAEQRGILLRRLRSRIDDSGLLKVEAQERRSQRRNRVAAVDRFQRLVVKALEKPKERKKTKPSAASAEKRLADKKHRGQRKRERGEKWIDP